MDASRPAVIAHVREFDGALQTLESHLSQTALLCSQFTTAIALPLCGRLLGLLHDFGKYSQAFQQYIREITGLLGEEARSAGEAKQGTIDHATAGAVHTWNRLEGKGKAARLLAQILSAALMSHHSRTGIKDFISLEGKSNFLTRLNSSEEECYYQECLHAAAPEILGEIDSLLSSPELLNEFTRVASRIKNSAKGKVQNRFSFGMLTRFLFSCLLDADRLDTANFEGPAIAQFRETTSLPDWRVLTDKLENRLADFSEDSEIHRIRRRISEECQAAATRNGETFTLSVPTGGGKTLASLRFALHRALHSPRPVERIIYVIPYTSIIEQNAAVAREILGDDNVLEHHSNITEERDTWRSRTLSENWDAPVVFTTSVQFLDALFAAGTRTARRMHQMAKSTIIFDEAQALPLKTFHLFNNAINFLTAHTHTTTVLCTATMPLLDRVDVHRGSLNLTGECEIISDKKSLSEQLRRTEVVDRTRGTRWSHDEVRDFALECTRCHRSTLVVCNTKDSARRLFEQLRSAPDAPEIIHLSTSMCPAHRRAQIDQLRLRLDPKDSTPIICVSTQLIEAGVDLDFGCVIRSLAGLDSIVQSAGRCNRHGYRPIGYVYILNFAEETLGPALAEIAKAQEKTRRVLGEFRDDPNFFNGSLLSEAAINRFYEYCYFERAEEMLYPLKAGEGKPPLAADTSLLALLAENPGGLEAAKREGHSEASSLPLQQAFSTAAQAFSVIDAPTRGLIVPYEKGREVIADLCAVLGNDAHPVAEQVRLLKRAQSYTVNAFPHVVEKLGDGGAIREVHPGSGVCYLDERHYHPDLGVTLEALSELHYLEAS